MTHILTNFNQFNSALKFDVTWCSDQVKLKNAVQYGIKYGEMDIVLLYFPIMWLYCELLMYTFFKIWQSSICPSANAETMTDMDQI